MCFTFREAGDVGGLIDGESGPSSQDSAALYDQQARRRYAPLQGCQQGWRQCTAQVGEMRDGERGLGFVSNVLVVSVVLVGHGD